MLSSDEEEKCGVRDPIPSSIYILHCINIADCHLKNSRLQVKKHILLPPPSWAGPRLQPQHGDGQAASLDQTFFHEKKKGGFFIGEVFTVYFLFCQYAGLCVPTSYAHLSGHLYRFSLITWGRH